VGRVNATRGRVWRGRPEKVNDWERASENSLGWTSLETNEEKGFDRLKVVISPSCEEFGILNVRCKYAVRNA